MGKINNRTDISTISIVQMYESGISANRIAECFKCSQCLVLWRLQSVGVKRRRFGHDGFPMESNPNWKGGAVEDRGYICVMLPTDHELRAMCDSKGYVRRHRLVMALHLGRPLLDTEIVHHKDRNRQHDEIANLELFSSNSEHVRLHASERKQAFALANGLEEG